MPEKKTPKRRTQVKDLPRKEKELTKEKQQKVKGGGVAHAQPWLDWGNAAKK